MIFSHRGHLPFDTWCEYCPLEWWILTMCDVCLSLPMIRNRIGVPLLSAKYITLMFSPRSHVLSRVQSRSAATGTAVLSTAPFFTAVSVFMRFILLFLLSIDSQNPRKKVLIYFQPAWKGWLKRLIRWDRARSMINCVYRSESEEIRCLHVVCVGSCSCSPPPAFSLFSSSMLQAIVSFILAHTYHVVVVEGERLKWAEWAD